MMVEDFAVFLAFAGFATAHAVRPDRITVLDPIDHVEVMDVLLADVVTANPHEVIPIAHLIFHFRHTGFAQVYPDTLIVPPGLR